MSKVEMMNSGDFLLSEIQSTVKAFIPKALEASALLEADIQENFSLTFSMYPVLLRSETKLSFIPTGTKSDTKGIGSYKGNLVVVFTEKGLLKILSKDSLREIIKANPDIFSRGVGPDFETMGVVVDTAKAIEYFNSELLFVEP